MSERTSTCSPLEMFEIELALLAEQYHEEPSHLSQRSIVEAIGRVFAARCLSQFGLKGYQYAEQGIQAILCVLGEMDADPGTDN